MCEVINVPVICGVETNIITAADINESTGGVIEHLGVSWSRERGI